MCCLFGILDYGHNLTPRQKQRMLSVLSAACEERGTDATGIAYSSGGYLRVFKRPLPAHRMRFHVPSDAHVIMGHTRMTTQGNEKFNQNNHPFKGTAGTRFALAHNGVLYNDDILRKDRHLPDTSIETDSYVAVQLLEQSGELSFSSLREMAEQLRGSFTFTVLDERDRLYIVRGNNPMCLYHWPDVGLYIYASTEEILLKALCSMPIPHSKPEKVRIDEGDILRIDRHGNRERSIFSTDKLYTDYWHYYRPYSFCGWGEEEYVEELKAVAMSFGLHAEQIDALLDLGITPDEIEEYLYCGEFI